MQIRKDKTKINCTAAVAYKRSEFLFPQHNPATENLEVSRSVCGSSPLLQSPVTTCPITLSISIRKKICQKRKSSSTGDDLFCSEIVSWWKAKSSWKHGSYKLDKLGMILGSWVLKYSAVYSLFISSWDNGQCRIRDRRSTGTETQQILGLLHQAENDGEVLASKVTAESKTTALITPLFSFPFGD